MQHAGHVPCLLDDFVTGFKGREGDLRDREAMVLDARDNRASAQEVPLFYEDRNRRHVDYQVTALILLKTEGTYSSGKSKIPSKCRPRTTGPLRILERIGEVS